MATVTEPVAQTTTCRRRFFVGIVIAVLTGFLFVFLRKEISIGQATRFITVENIINLAPEPNDDGELAAGNVSEVRSSILSVGNDHQYALRYRALVGKWNSSSVSSTLLAVPAMVALAISTRRSLFLDWSSWSDGQFIPDHDHPIFQILENPHNSSRSATDSQSASVAYEWAERAAAEALDVSSSRLLWSIAEFPSESFSVGRFRLASSERNGVVWSADIASERDVFLYRKVVVMHGHADILQIMNTSQRYSNTIPQTLPERKAVMHQIFAEILPVQRSVINWLDQYGPKAWPATDLNILIMLPTEADIEAKLHHRLRLDSSSSVKTVSAYVNSIVQCLHPYGKGLCIGHIHFHVGPRCASRTLFELLNQQKKIPNVLWEKPCLNGEDSAYCDTLNSGSRPRSCILKKSSCAQDQNRFVEAQVSDVGETLAYASRSDIVIGSVTSELVRLAAWTALSSDRNKQGTSIFLRTGEPLTKFVSAIHLTSKQPHTL